MCHAASLRRSALHSSFRRRRHAGASSWRSGPITTLARRRLRRFRSTSASCRPGTRCAASFPACGKFCRSPGFRGASLVQASSGQRNRRHFGPSGTARVTAFACEASIGSARCCIEQLASRHVPPEGPFEHWAVEGNEAYEYSNPDRVITYAEMRAELKARPTTRRIIHRYVHALDGRPAPCCLPGGECYALHGPTKNQAA